MKINDLQKRISLIGRRLVNCSFKCNGISCDQNKGIIPRCLVLEIDGRTKEKGCVIVGINPGIPRSPSEHNYYVSKGISYDSLLSYYWKRPKGIHNHPYYTRLGELANCLELTGPILWTELVKCESQERGKLPPVQTFRVCVEKFLNDELRSVPDDWPIIAVGREAYKAMAYLYPKRIVIGVPHPTSSRGYFSNLFDKNKNIKFHFRIHVSKLWENGRGLETWLGSTPGKVK